jgi:DNA-directed RNA polymerase subunit RPC12/RpoP
MAQFEITCPNCGAFCMIDMAQDMDEHESILEEWLKAIELDIKSYSYLGELMCPKCSHRIRATLVVSSVNLDDCPKFINIDSATV